MKLSSTGKADRSWLAFTLIEVLVSVSIVGIMFLSLYGGITSGFAVINVARENLRATQIMVEKMEVMRLYTWDQVNSNGFVPLTFTASYYPPIGTTNDQQNSAVTNGGIVYYGTISFSNAPVSTNYSSSVKLVTVTMYWTNGTYTHQRSMQTLVSANGIQAYVY